MTPIDLDKDLSPYELGPDVADLDAPEPPSAARIAAAERLADAQEDDTTFGEVAVTAVVSTLVLIGLALVGLWLADALRLIDLAKVPV